MDDVILSADDVNLQDIICTEIMRANKNESDVVIYNRICRLVNIPSLQVAVKVLRLIHLNQSILNYGG